MTWTVVVLVASPSRIETPPATHLTPAQHENLARAFALDTIAAARAAREVDRVVVVADDADAEALAAAASRSAGLGGALPTTAVPTTAVPTTAVPTTAGLASAGQASASPASAQLVHLRVPASAGLDAAVRAGIAAARSKEPHAVAVLVGNLPALKPEELDDALRAASGSERAVVVDARLSGTTLVTAGPGTQVEPVFGMGSARTNVVRGHQPIKLPMSSGLRQSVNDFADLVAATRLGLGANTAAALDQIGMSANEMGEIPSNGVR